MNIHITTKENVEYLDKILLDENGLLKVVPHKDISGFPGNHLIQWANEKGVYCIPTTELIDWLKERIAGRKCIEICAGYGAIGRSLRIITTDSHIQADPNMAIYYKSIGQKAIDPPSDVLKFEANEAVDTLHPEVVVASFATQKFQKGDDKVPKIGSSVYGVDELALFKKVKTYIFIGNDVTHKDKRLLEQHHETFRFDWLVTRCVSPESNHIKVWENDEYRTHLD